MIHPQGFNTDPAFQGPKAGGGTRGVFDTTRLFYDGNSQGGIIGGALISVAPDLDRGSLGVLGMNYSTLLERSKDFDTYAQILYRSYPDEGERLVLLDLLQMLWDRAEADGYALHMTSDPFPGTPAHTVLLHGALGDHQVAQITAETEARTVGARYRTPWADPGRDLDRSPVYGLMPITAFPWNGSAIVLWDSGPLRTVNGESKGTPPPPNVDQPPRVGNDPHELPRRTPAAREQKSEFLKVGGRVVDTCAPKRPCYSDGYTGP
jgi:hypothetical protein